MRTQIKEVQGVDWFDAAVMNCTWEGPRLRDVLVTAGIESLPAEETVQTNGSTSKSHLHVQLASYGSKTQEDKWYGGSIPLERAMDPEMDVILAVKVCKDNTVNMHPLHLYSSEDCHENPCFTSLDPTLLSLAC